MKKIALIGVMIGIASWAQAGSITILSPGSQISGAYSYIYRESYTLAPNTQVTGASISFDITLTAGGPANIPNTLYYDLLNGNYAATGSNPINSGETGSDYFQTSTSPKYSVDPLGHKTFKPPVTKNGKTTYDEEIVTGLLFSPTAVQHLNNDISAYGFFDIGLDPNCTFYIKSISITITTGPKTVSVPDQATTASLLGMSFLGLLAFRRKLAFN